MPRERVLAYDSLRERGWDGPEYIEVPEGWRQLRPRAPLYPGDQYYSVGHGAFRPVAASWRPGDASVYNIVITQRTDVPLFISVDICCSQAPRCECDEQRIYAVEVPAGYARLSAGCVHRGDMILVYRRDGPVGEPPCRWRPAGQVCLGAPQSFYLAVARRLPESASSAIGPIPLIPPTTIRLHDRDVEIPAGYVVVPHYARVDGVNILRNVEPEDLLFTTGEIPEVPGTWAAARPSQIGWPVRGRTCVIRRQEMETSRRREYVRGEEVLLPVGSVRVPPGELTASGDLFCGFTSPVQTWDTATGGRVVAVDELVIRSLSAESPEPAPPATVRVRGRNIPLPSDGEWRRVLAMQRRRGARPVPSRVQMHDRLYSADPALAANPWIEPPPHAIGELVLDYDCVIRRRGSRDPAREEQDRIRRDIQTLARVPGSPNAVPAGYRSVPVGGDGRPQRVRRDDLVYGLRGWQPAETGAIGRPVGNYMAVCRRDHRRPNEPPEGYILVTEGDVAPQDLVYIPGRGASQPGHWEPLATVVVGCPVSRYVGVARLQALVGAAPPRERAPRVLDIPEDAAPLPPPPSAVPPRVRPLDIPTEHPPEDPFRQALRIIRDQANLGLRYPDPKTPLQELAVGIIRAWGDSCEHFVSQCDQLLRLMEHEQWQPPP